MKTRVLYITVAAMMMAVSLFAQNNSTHLVNVMHYQAEKDGNDVNIQYVFDYENLVLERDQQLVVTPLMVMVGDTVEMPSVLFRAGTREKVVQRKKALYGTNPDVGLYDKVAFTNKEMRHRKVRISGSQTAGTDVVDYDYTMPYNPEMQGASMILRQELTYCGKVHPYYTAMSGVMPEMVEARQMFAKADDGSQKVRKEEMTAYIIFEQGKSDIKRELANNAAELDSIYFFTETILSNRDFDVTSVHIKGYASPEGSYALNSRLSMSRVMALRDHLEQKYRLRNAVFTMDNEPEDWEGVRKWADASGGVYRTQILDIIDNTPDPDARDAKLRALDNGVTYNMMLREVYPKLRRVDYSIGYTITPFTVERGREMINVDPTMMSLREMQQVADSYPFGSEQYRNALETILKYYPEDQMANNNMGLIEYRNGNTGEAEQYFRKAAAQGSGEAAFNLENINFLR